VRSRRAMTVISVLAALVLAASSAEAEFRRIEMKIVGMD
jgi:hypothetical protein